MMGRIAAGRPLEAVEEHETLSLGEFARSDKTFVLQVKGSSMIEDHILNAIMWSSNRRRLPIPVKSSWRWWAMTRRRSSVFIASPAERFACNRELGNVSHHRLAADVKIQGRVVGSCASIDGNFLR